MARIKSLIIQVQIDRAGKAHSCQANARHRLERAICVSRYGVAEVGIIIAVLAPNSSLTVTFKSWPICKNF